MRERKDRVHGPYQHRNQWRVLVVTADGARGYRYFATEREGEAYVREARIATEHRTVGVAVADYLRELRDAGGKRPSTLKTTECRLLSMLRLREHDTPMGDLQPALAEKLYARRCKEVRVDTHRGELVVCGQFGAWCVAKGYRTENPFSAVKPRGEVSTGKEQLYVDEAKIFLRVALEDGSVDGTACATVLIFGLRASELVNLTPADVDAGGTILRVATGGKGKTRNATRNIAIPPEPAALRQQLLALRDARGERLFPDMTRYRLHYQVGRVCSEAGVRRVCPHGLRGSALTAAVSTGSLATAQAFGGHRIGSNVTERHYLAPGTIESGDAARRGSLLADTYPTVRADDTIVGNEWATERERAFPIEGEGDSGDLN